MTSEKPREPRTDVTVKDIAHSILFAKREGELGRVIFLIGAGCSVSAHIPVAATIAQRMVKETAVRLRLVDVGTEPFEAYLKLVSDTGFPDCRNDSKAEAKSTDDIDWHHVYDEMFARYYRTPDDTRVLFGRIVDEAQDALNWAHLCLGEIVAQGLVSTVLTTNFDQLALAGMVHAGIIPVISDGIESLTRVAPHPSHPQLVELHGSRHAYRLRNRRDEVDAVRHEPLAIEAIRGLLKAATTVVVVGYAGREDGVMDLLCEAAKTYEDKNLFWVQYSNKPDELSSKARIFLDTSCNGRLMVGQDADVFFLDLCRELKIGAPKAVSDPLASVGRVIAQLTKAQTKQEDIRAEISESERRVNVARECLRRDASEKMSIVAQLRELRLAGKVDEAYLLAQKYEASTDGTLETDPAILWELATIASDYAKTCPETEPFIRAEGLWRRLAERRDLGASPQQYATLEWADALLSLGRRSPEAARLEESVTVYRTLLASLDRTVEPLKWANVQNKLGNALLIFGERARGTEQLAEAVNTYRAALEERTRERAPLDWAATQNNLGNALFRLGERESGTETLIEAITAYRAALEERTRQDAPLDWAATQINLGNALACLGERENGCERLAEAVEAYRAALMEKTRERAPLHWAATQNNLGSALEMLGTRGSSERLHEAIEAYRAALQELTRERMPLHWAATQNNLGNALLRLGERENDSERLIEAVAAYRAAQQEWTRQRVPLDWATTQNNLGTALERIGERENRADLLVESVEAYRSALQERTREFVPLDWATTQNNLGTALSSLGEIEDDTERLVEAIEALRAALEVRTRERIPFHWASTEFNLGGVLALIAERTGDLATWDQAEKSVQNALEVFTQETSDGLHAKASELLTKIRTSRASAELL